MTLQEQLNAMYAQDEKANTDILGALEALASISSGAVAEPLAGLFGLLGAATTQDSNAAARGVEMAREALTYKPRREEGQVALQNVAEGLAPIGEAIQGAQVGAGDYVFDKTESPLLAALTQAAVGGAPDIAGVKLGSRALPKGPSFDIGDIGSQMGRQRGSLAGLERGQHGANHFIVGEQPNIAMPKKAQKRLSDLDYKATYEPHIIKPKSLMDMIGEKGVLTMVDRTPTGGVVQEIRGKRLHTPQYLDGGDDFGTDAINNEAWANSGEYLNILQNRMGDDKKLNYLTMLMAPTSVDFPTMAPATHMRFAYPYTSKKDLSYVAELIKKGAPDMGIKQGGDALTPVPSFDWSIMDKDPTAVDRYLKTLSGPQRKSINAIFEALADPSPNQKKAGLKAMPDNFLTTQERQMVMTKPEYRNLPSTMQITRGHIGGRNVGPADHFTYRSAVDKIDDSFIPAEELTAYDLMPELFPKSTRDYIHPNDAWTARMGARTFDIDQALIDRLGEQGRFD